MYVVSLTLSYNKYYWICIQIDIWQDLRVYSGIGEAYLSLLAETIHAHSTATLRLNKIEGNVQKRMIGTCNCRNFAMLTKRLTTRTHPEGIPKPRTTKKASLCQSFLFQMLITLFFTTSTLVADTTTNSRMPTANVPHIEPSSVSGKSVMMTSM